MPNCVFCNKPIPKKRGGKFSRHRVIYCSEQCNKRAYYIKKKQSNSSFFYNRKEWENTETGKGYLWEVFVANLLSGVWQGFGKPFDVLWGDLRVDVKTCELYRRRNKRGKPVDPEAQSGWYAFHKHSRKADKSGVDYLFCIGLFGGVPQKMWLIPFDAVPKHFTITSNPSKKYNKYLFRTL